MKESLKYGLLTGLGYCAIVSAIYLVAQCIGNIARSVDDFLYSFIEALPLFCSRRIVRLLHLRCRAPAFD